MKKIFKKLGIYALLSALVLVGGYVAYQKNKPDNQPHYVTEVVQKGDIEQVVLASGMLQASKLVNVGAQVSGQVKSLAVKLGDQLEEGDFVAEIDSLTQQNNLKEAQASLDIIQAQYRAKRAQLKQAEAEFNRQKNMLADRSSSRADYESAEANLAVYQAELEQLKAQEVQAEIKVDNAKLDLGYTTITAPMSGVVVYTAVEEGQTVNSNQTTPTIIELAELKTMTVEAQISEADVTHVKPGQDVFFTILGHPNKRFRGVLKAIEPGPTVMDGDDSDLSAESSEAIYYNALFDVENEEMILRIGMTAEVSIVLDRSEDAILIPAQVLQKLDVNTYQVPVLENGEMVMKNVEVGINNKVKAEILSGLEVGDEIILGSDLVEPSAQMRRSRIRI